jgi:hypothetical protein
VNPGGWESYPLYVIRKQQATGSNPVIGSNFEPNGSFFACCVQPFPYSFPY